MNRNTAIIILVALSTINAGMCIANIINQANIGVIMLQAFAAGFSGAIAVKIALNK